MNRLLHRFASLRLTLAGLVLLAIGLVADQKGWLPGAWVITPPLGLLALNLAAALTVDPRFRGRPSLFAFHLCLLLLALLAGYGQLGTFKARLVLMEGQAYSPGLVGPTDDGMLPQVRLSEGVWHQGSIEVDFAPASRRGATRSRVWVDGRGWLEVGDDVPLILDGYRFYTTSNKGFAAILEWRPDQGEVELGAIRFPSFPARALGQFADWQTPAGEALRITLALPPAPYAESWTLSVDMTLEAQLEIEAAARRLSLRPGESVALAGGRLRLQGWSTWMGYTVRYDPTLPWLFSLATLAVFFMTTHIAARVLRTTRVPGKTAGRYLT